MRQFITQKTPFFYGYCNFIADKAQVEEVLEEAKELTVDGFCFLPVYFTIKLDTDSEGGFWLSFVTATKSGLHKLAVNVWITSDLPANIRAVIDRFFKEYGFKNVCPCLYELFQPPKPLNDNTLENSLPY